MKLSFRIQNLMMSSGLVFQKALYASSEPMAVFHLLLKKLEINDFWTV
jgi:hypothetical protein